MQYTFESIDDVRNMIGSTLGDSKPVLVDQCMINAYADLVGDHQWIHVDPIRAARGPYGKTIAHGYLTVGLLSRFAEELYEVSFGSAKINYGLNKVRFPSPVLVDSRLRATATITELVETQVGALITQEFAVRADGEKKPACIAERLTLRVN